VISRTVARFCSLRASKSIFLVCKLNHLQLQVESQFFVLLFFPKKFRSKKTIERPSSPKAIISCIIIVVFDTLLAP
jgi:hypothetical protein